MQLAEGRVFITGTGALQQWELETDAKGGATFEPGPATAVALVRTTIDAHQWLVNITLLRE